MERKHIDPEKKVFPERSLGDQFFEILLVAVKIRTSMRIG